MRRGLVCTVAGLMIIIIIVGVSYRGVRQSRHSTSGHESGVVSSVELKRAIARFDEVAKAIRSMMRDNNGHFPSDPYRQLICRFGSLDMADLIFQNDVVRFDPLRTPARFNAELSKNGKFPVCWLIPRENLPEVWTVYADGSWERITSGGDREFSDIQKQSWSTFANTSYPHWLSQESREKWINRNWNSLEWNDRMGFYVPQKQVTE